MAQTVAGIEEQDSLNGQQNTQSPFDLGGVPYSSDVDNAVDSDNDSSQGSNGSLWKLTESGDCEYVGPPTDIDADFADPADLGITDVAAGSPVDGTADDIAEASSLQGHDSHDTVANEASHNGLKGETGADIFWTQSGAHQLLRDETKTPSPSIDAPGKQGSANADVLTSIVGINAFSLSDVTGSYYAPSSLGAPSILAAFNGAPSSALGAGVRDGYVLDSLDIGTFIYLDNDDSKTPAGQDNLITMIQGQTNFSLPDTSVLYV